MFVKPSLITRIAIGKGIGLLIGLAGFISLSWILPEADWAFRWGILLWYPTLGAFVGVFGVFTWHPVLNLPMPWWVRAPWVGAWMNLVLALFVHEEIRQAMEVLIGPGDAVEAAFWFVVEGAVVGLLIGYCATRFGGEGVETVDR